MPVEDEGMARKQAGIVRNEGFYPTFFMGL